jgi:pimeloyl-ACP methyl ester carboxylesterase
MQQHELLGYIYDIKRITLPSGKELAMMDEGTGDQTILFIHGLANYAAVWNMQLFSLKDTYRCIAIDLPGNGLSAPIETTYNIELYTQTIIEVIVELNLKNLVLCGHSMGGLIAMNIALDAPNLVSKLVLIAPAGIEYFNPLEVLWMKQLLTIGNFVYSDEQHLEQAIHQSFYKQQNNAETIINDLKKIMQQQSLKLWRNMCVDSIISMLDHQLNGKLAQITQPALVLFGKQDALVPNRVIHPFTDVNALAVKAKELMPLSDVSIIDNAGHFVQIESSELVNKAIRVFLG